MVARCPDSVLGNGTAQFAFAQVPSVLLDGQIIAFNGGLKNGLPLVKVYAYSYDTSVGIYTEGVLDNNGRLKFDVEQLTADSSVTTLDLAIPGERQVLSGVDPGGDDVILPKGVKSNYVLAKCSSGQFMWDNVFTHGTRDTNGDPTSPDTFTTDSGSEPCTGVTGKAKIKSVKVKGSSKAKRNKKASYTVKIKNTGVVAAKAVKLKVSGKGVSAKANAGNIGAGKTKTVKVKARFRKKGRIKATFKATSKNGGSKSARKSVKVK
jgi:hypothetical protein